MIKKIVKGVAYMTGGLVVVIGGLCAWIAATDVPQYPAASIASERYIDSAHLALGSKIVNSRCAYCHLGDDGKLSGRKFSPAESPFGEMWSKNITQSTEHGIAAYSDGELAYLFRTGINRKGVFVGPYMSSVLQSDEDINSVISYLRSGATVVQKSDVPNHDMKAGFLLKALLKFKLFKPLEYDSKPRAAVRENDDILYGKYLVDARYSCSECHSKSFETNDPYVPEHSVGYLGGGNEIMDKDFKLTLSKNISPSKVNGIGSWTFEQFATSVTSGLTPTGKVLSQSMPRLPLLDSIELRAIWRYLQTVPAIENSVATK